MSISQSAASRERCDSEAAANRRTDKRFAVDRGLAKVRCKKFEVDGAVANVLPRGLLGLLFRMRGTSCDVINLSKGGMAIETRTKHGRGRRITLQLQMPDADEALTLTGIVRWEKQLAHSKYCTIGIQFDPFSTREGCNPPSALEALRAIEARYAD